MDKFNERMTGHTPGPWAISVWAEHHESAGSPASIYAEDDNETHICELSPPNARSEEELANATLMAASPDLLAACELVANEPCLERFFGEDIANTLRAAIKKAKGE